METINNIFSLTPAEIDYRVTGITNSQREILSHIMQGKSDKEIAGQLNISVGVLRERLDSACVRAGVNRRGQVIALYAIWAYYRSRDDRAE